MPPAAPPPALLKPSAPSPLQLDRPRLSCRTRGRALASPDALRPPSKLGCSVRPPSPSWSAGPGHSVTGRWTEQAVRGGAGGQTGPLRLCLPVRGGLGLGWGVGGCRPWSRALGLGWSGLCSEAGCAGCGRAARTPGSLPQRGAAALSAGRQVTLGATAFWAPPAGKSLARSLGLSRAAEPCPFSRSACPWLPPRLGQGTGCGNAPRRGCARGPGEPWPGSPRLSWEQRGSGATGGPGVAGVAWLFCHMRALHPLLHPVFGVG